MPELPEVETIKRELEKSISGKKIKDALVRNPKVIKEPKAQEFVRQIKGSTIKNIFRKGKLLILELSGGKFLAIHLKMTGQLIFPGDAKKSRVSFKFSDGKLLDFNDQRLFAELRLIKDWKELKFIQQLGPEPFSLDEKDFSRMLSKKNAKIKPLLMDQTFIAGIGNLYAAEALFRARIHPARKASSLTEKEKKVLFKEILNTLRDAIKHQGSSIDQYVQLNGSKGNFVKYHKVYDRKDEPCFACKHPIKRISLGGRGTYFCPKCQK